MSVDTRAHIDSAVLQERAVLRRMFVYGTNAGGRYDKLKALAVKGHNGDEIRLSLADLGAALRVLKVKPADLGYPPPRRVAGPKL